jgi:D-3-phosphoglycerate dehydrogenase
MTNNILITEVENYSSKAISIYENLGNVFYRSNYSPDQITVLVVRLALSIDSVFLQPFINLKYILSPTTGINHIDSMFCERNNIQIISLRGEFEFLQKINATPEFTFSLFLTLVKNIYSSSFDSRKFGILNLNRLNYLSKEFNEIKVGIAGYGRVGKKIHQYCKNLNIDVIAFDPYLDICNNNSLNVNIETDVFKFLNSIDVLLICISYNASNIKYFSSDKLNYLKPDSIVINTARGEVLDENAVIDLLLKGKLKAAALDVLSLENNNNKALLKKIMNYVKNYNNLILTPHIAGASKKSMHLTEVFIANKLKTIISNHEINLSSN